MLCPFSPKGCEWAGTYRCDKECEYHPENFIHEKDVLERFDAEPWSVYCFTCQDFLDSRGGHPEDHTIVTGLDQYREILPQVVLEKMTAHHAETGDMTW